MRYFTPKYWKRWLNFSLLVHLDIPSIVVLKKVEENCSTWLPIHNDSQWALSDQPPIFLQPVKSNELKLAEEHLFINIKCYFDINSFVSCIQNGDLSKWRPSEPGYVCNCDPVRWGECFVWPKCHEWKLEIQVYGKQAKYTLSISVEIQYGRWICSFHHFFLQDSRGIL